MTGTMGGRPEMRLTSSVLLGLAVVSTAAAAIRWSGAPPAPAPRVGVVDAHASIGTEKIPIGDPRTVGPNFFFARAAYSFQRRGARTDPGWTDGVIDPRRGWSSSQPCDGGYCGWATDFPKGDLQFLSVLRRLTNLDASPSELAIRLDDPDLRRYPFIYAVEVGYMWLTQDEVIGLRDYLLAGGFLLVDDFWGTAEWKSFEEEMARVLPEHPIVDIPLDHPIFRTFYQVDEILQVPNAGQGVRGGPTHEQDGYVPHVRGIFDASGRLMVAISWNSDLGDAWEWAEQARYPLEYSTYAYQLGVNFILHAMSH